MVLESILPVDIAEKEPFDMLPLAFLYSTLAIFIAYWIFPTQASLTIVFFTVMALLPMMVALMKFEEANVFSHRFRVKEPHHKRAVPFFVYMFLGMTIAFSVWFILFPQDMVNQIFGFQMNSIQAINQNVAQQTTAQAISVSSYFSAVVSNNLNVLLFVLLFSFIYGAGAIFILTWNASVLAVAIGNVARNFVSTQAINLGNTGVASHFAGFSLGMLRYMIHGIPEIGAYFVAGLAGGMISVAVIKHDFMDEKFKEVMFDSANLVLFAIGLLFMAGVLETFVSPLVPI